MENRRKIVLIRSTPGVFEPRFMFAKDFLSVFGSNPITITWSRTLSDISHPSSDAKSVFSHQAAYGRGWKNALIHLRFMFFTYSEIRKINPDLVYACDLDTLIPSMLWRIRSKKPIVFDQFDPLSARSKSRILSTALDYLEYFLSSKADLRITANMMRVKSRTRKSWIEVKNLFVFTLETKKELEFSDKFKLIYGGVLSFDRGLIECAKAIAMKPDWEFHLYGQGDLLSELRDQGFKNVFVHNPIPHLELMKISSGADLLAAMYDPSRTHNRLTASNKLFEACQLGVPLLTTKETSIGEITERNHLGWSVKYADALQITMVLDEIRSYSEENRLNIINNMQSYFESQLKDRDIALNALSISVRKLLRFHE
jgi:hypothetical protein